jgi:hypothetical protein
MGTMTILEWFRRVPGTPPLEKSSSSPEIMLRRFRNMWDPWFIFSTSQKVIISKKKMQEDARGYSQPCYKA